LNREVSRFLKKWVFEAINPYRFPGRLLDRGASSLLRGEGIILLFHRVKEKEDLLPSSINRTMAISSETLERILLFFLDHGFSFVSMDDIYFHLSGEIELSFPFAAVTFDDGYNDLYHVALPVFRKHQIPFAAYLTTSFLDGKGILWWYLLEDLLSSRDHLDFRSDGQSFSYRISDRNRETVFCDLRKLLMGKRGDHGLYQALFEDNGLDLYGYSEECLTWEMAAEMSADPLVTFGAHGRNHLMLSSLVDEQQLETEILGSVSQIENNLGIRVFHFSYPFGRKGEIGQKAIDLVWRSGLRTGVSAFPGHLRRKGGGSRYLAFLPRINVGEEKKASSRQIMENNISGLLPALVNIRDRSFLKRS